ncbi:hypothetical protein AB7849_15580 [Rhodanobacter sp. 115]|uniref:hypothetical protein n=1 Tax=Rhodanobacter sp. FW021-MT20 TaxID=1162282 RepID=UPI0034E4EE7F
MSNTLQPGQLGYLTLDNYPHIPIRVKYQHSAGGVDHYEIPSSEAGSTGISTTINGQPAGTYHHVQINGDRDVHAYDPTGVLKPMHFGKGGV